MEKLLKRTEEILNENNIIFEEACSDGPDISSFYILNKNERLTIKIEKTDNSIIIFEFSGAYIEKYATISHNLMEIGFNIFSDENDNKIQIRYSIDTGKEHILINELIIIPVEEIKDINIKRV